MTRYTGLRIIANALLLLCSAVCNVRGFGIIDPSSLQDIHAIANANTDIIISSFQQLSISPPTESLSFLQDQTNVPSNLIASSVTAPTSSSTFNFLESYKQTLATHPLMTKMMTGGTLAVCGDFIAQSQSSDPYDKRRARSFAAFDCVYRAVQHVSFPAIVQQCQGQYIGALVSALGVGGVLNTALGDDTSYYLGAMEQTLASQLGIVPFFYYPVFYTVTALVQGLDQEQAVQRAKDTFIPLMKRNLLFWIPVQFVQFGFIDESLQIPFLSVAGLGWTFIISLFAGNANANVKEEAEAAIIEIEDELNLGITKSDRKVIEEKIIPAGVRDSKSANFQAEKDVVLR